MPDQPYQVYVIQGRGPRDYADCQSALLTMDDVIATPHAAYFSSAAVARVPRRCGEEVARVR